jgi:proline-specific peptidase
MAEQLHQEGFIDFCDHKTWYSAHGDLGSTSPLLVLHGGPGLPHDYLQPLSALSEAGQPVVFYDQLGCGRSNRPDDPELWTIDLFIEEIDVVRNALGLSSVKVLGHSWGGSLALEYSLTKPAGLEKLILHSPLVDSKLWVEEAERLKDTLPADIATTMRKHEHAGTTDTEEYQAAYKIFKDNFVCRIDPRPPLLVQAVEGYGTQVYETLWGPSEDYATGKLKDWTILDRLGNVDVPTLIISGKYDEATPLQMSKVADAIKGSEWTILENSSHQAQLEEPDAYLTAVKDFLAL